MYCIISSTGCKVFGEANQQVIRRGYDNDKTNEDKWDVIVIDGTWSHAQKPYSRYIPWKMDGGPTRVQLRDEALALLSTSDSGERNLHDNSSAPAAGHQLRRHPIQWKAISTLEAIHLLLNDMADAIGKYGATSQLYPWNVLSSYQQIADDATSKNATRTTPMIHIATSVYSTIVCHKNRFFSVITSSCSCLACCRL